MNEQRISAPAIRPASTVDAPAIAALGARLFRESYGPTHPEPELTRYLSRDYSPDAFRAALDEGGATILIVEGDDGAPIGYAWLRESPEPPAGVKGEKVFEILRFYIDGAYQGRGFGAMLMSRCWDEARSRGGDAVWLQTWTKAPWAIGFYERMGFNVVGTTSFHFGERVDTDHVMARSI